jgi:PAS domain-containing protein
MTIPKIIGVLAAVMIATFALWEGLEALLFAVEPPVPLSLFYMIRGITTAVVMTALTAWLMLRYRRGFEERLRRQSEQAERMRVFFENIVRDAGEAIISLDTRGIVRTWNRAAETIYGYAAAAASATTRPAACARTGRS